MKKTNLILSSIILFTVFALGVFLNGGTSPTIVRAGTGENVSGFAWANTPQSTGGPTTGTNQGVGWISFNNLSDGSARVYGVNVDDSTRLDVVPGNGNFSGYAWSENLGWISFAPPGPYPEAPNYSARINWSTGEVTGWARACAGSANPNTTCTGNNSGAGGMDGWIKLSGIADNGGSYGVSVDITSGSPTENQFSGYAWGSEVIGWIDFYPSAGNGVVVGPPVLPGCNDGVDNDLDGSIDGADPDCGSGGSGEFAPVNNDPIAIPDSISTNRNTPKNINVIGNDTDSDGDTLYIPNTAGSVTPPSNGTATRRDNVTVRYIPDTGFTGVDTFNYTVSDGNGGTDIGTVTVTVNAPPVCNNNGTCDLGENIANCPLDCTPPSPTVCGNDICESTETLLNCPGDCFRIKEF